MADKRVLLLNQGYEPLMGISLRRALKHIANEKVEVLHSEDCTISSGGMKMQLPTVIRLNKKNYNKVFRFEPRYSKKGIHCRDNFTCAYCGQRHRESDLTIDHIVPRSKGGLSTWTNCITACRKCNSYKADFSIEETKMYLTFKPYIPKNLILINNWAYRDHPHWLKYLTNK